jgi:hypothetical protein
VHLAWWHAELVGEADPTPNPLEVESIHWLEPEEIMALPNLLDSNRDFIAGLLRGDVLLRLE